MKLYTEQQVIKAMDLYFSPIRPLKSQVIEKLTPIELPSDEEIKDVFTTEHYNTDKGRYRKIKLDRIYGAKWMKEQILNQNK